MDCSKSATWRQESWRPSSGPVSWAWVTASWAAGCWLAVLLSLLGTSLTAAEPKRLTTDGRRKFSPVFIDETELVYVDFVKPVLFQIQQMTLADGRVEALHSDAKAPEMEPAFSADGRYCAFVQTRGALSLALVIRDRRKNQDAAIPPAPGFAGYRSPTFSPDGKRVVYSFAEEGKQSLFSVDIQAQNRRRLTDHVGIDNWPMFSPDGKQILFGSTRDGNFEIYTMDADGKHVKQLTHSPFQDLRPRYSPDGRRIVFTSNRDGNFEIYTMHTDGSHLRRITNHPERDDYATWHPAGDSIVLVSERSGRHDLYHLPIGK